MAQYSKTILGMPGQNTVTDPGLYAAQIMMVSRSGLVHEEVEGTPGNMEFRYSGSTIEFDPTNPFNGTGVGRINRSLLEKIVIIYKL